MRQTFRHQIAAWTLTAALTLTVQAADGVIEINQASVEAAGGFPFEITQAGSYRLTGNLEVDDVDTTAIWVRAYYVTVDLNGFSILGPVLCDSDGACPEGGDGAGVWAGPTLPGDDDLISPGENQNQPPIPIGVEVRNGVVSGMGHTGVGGIREGRVETVRAISNGRNGISVRGGLVTGCVASRNGVNGIFGTNALIESNTVIRNFGNGILADFGAVVGNNVQASPTSESIGGVALFLSGAAYAGNSVQGGIAGTPPGIELGCNVIDDQTFCPPAPSPPE